MDFCADIKITANFSDRVVNISKKIFFNVMDNRVQQRKCLLKVRGSLIGLLELIQHFCAVEIRRDFTLNDIKGIGRLLEGQREPRIRTIKKYTVAVYPAFFGILDIIINNKLIHFCYKLKVAKIR